MSDEIVPSIFQLMCSYTFCIFKTKADITSCCTGVKHFDPVLLVCLYQCFSLQACLPNLFKTPLHYMIPSSGKTLLPQKITTLVVLHA